MNQLYCNRTIKYYLALGIVWTFLGILTGFLNQLQLFLHVPATDTALGFGFLRPIHTSILIFGGGLSLFFAAGYYVLARQKELVFRYGVLAFCGFVFHQLALIIGVVTIMMGGNQGREYGEMSYHSDDLLAGALIVFLAVHILTLKGRLQNDRSSTFSILAAAGGLVAYLIGNFSLPYGPLHSAPLFFGLQDAALQEYYRSAVLGYFILLPVFSILYYFLPSYYRLSLYSNRMADFQILAMMFLIPLTGASWLAHSAAPSGLQTLGVVTMPLLMVAVLMGALNLWYTISRSGTRLRSDSIALFFRWGLVFLIFNTIVHFFAAGRGFQATFAYTWWNSMDISLDALIYVYLIFSGAAYLMLQSIQDRTISRFAIRMQLFCGVFGIIFILLSNIIHGLLQAHLLQGVDDAGALTVGAWSQIVFSGSLSATIASAMDYIFSLRGLNFIGYLLLLLGGFIGFVGSFSALILTGEKYTVPDLHIGGQKDVSAGAA